MTTLDNTIILRFDETKVAKKKIYGAKKTIKIWDVDVHNIVISELIETKYNYKYLINYLDQVIRPLVVILPRISGYVNNFKKKNNKFMILCIYDDKLLQKYKTIWIKTEELKNVELNTLSVYGKRYIKAKIRTDVDKVDINFYGLNMPEDNVEYKSFAIISIDFLLAYENK